MLKLGLLALATKTSPKRRGEEVKHTCMIIYHTTDQHATSIRHPICSASSSTVLRVHYRAEPTSSITDTRNCFKASASASAGFKMLSKDEGISNSILCKSGSVADQRHRIHEHLEFQKVLHAVLAHWFESRLEIQRPDSDSGKHVVFESFLQHAQNNGQECGPWTETLVSQPFVAIVLFRKSEW